MTQPSIPATTTMHDERPELWQRWDEAAANPAIDARLRELFAELRDEAAAQGPVCELSGRCCHFDAYGHRLYVTGLEIAWALRQARAARRRSLVGQSAEPTRRIAMPDAADDVDLRGPCPFQVDRVCTVHEIRPLGCRIFFCDERHDDWQHEAYERFLAALRQLHEAHGLAYRYMEWRAGLREALEQGEAAGTG